jgi:four helix bundle protein
VAVFAHSALDAHRIALEALVRGDAIARKLPRGYGPLRDQLSRALQSAYLQTDEGAAKSGAERRVRLSSARAEAGEAAAALEAVVALGLGSRSEGQAVMVLLSRLCAMLTGLCNKAGG